RDLHEALRERHPGPGAAHREVVAEELRLLLQPQTREAVERLEEEDALEDAREEEPRRVAPREVRELVREDALLLLRVELRERGVGHADLAASERDRACEPLGAREPHAAFQPRVLAERVDEREEPRLADRRAASDADE